MRQDDIDYPFSKNNRNQPRDFICNHPQIGNGTHSSRAYYIDLFTGAINNDDRFFFLPVNKRSRSGLLYGISATSYVALSDPVALQNQSRQILISSNMHSFRSVVLTLLNSTAQPVLLYCWRGSWATPCWRPRQGCETRIYAFNASSTGTDRACTLCPVFHDSQFLIRPRSGRTVGYKHSSSESFCSCSEELTLLQLLGA